MRIPVVREGMYLVKIFLGLCLAFYILGKYFSYFFLFISIIFLILCGFTMFFFRDPSRKVTLGEGLFLSPADGFILDIEDARCEEDTSFQGKTKVVKIFMSIFNVHIQRAPADGIVKFIRYKPGKFLPANTKNAYAENEQNLIGVETQIKGCNSENKKNDKPAQKVCVLIKQIAGIIARRIVCWVEEGESVRRGQKIGLIKFGSQVNIYLPQDFEILVKKRGKVKAGITTIAKMKGNSDEIAHRS